MFTAVKHFSPEIVTVTQYEKPVLKVLFPKLAIFKGSQARSFQINRDWPVKRFILQILKTFNIKNWQRFYLETPKGFQFDPDQTFGDLGFGSVFPGLQVNLKRRPLKKKGTASPTKSTPKSSRLEDSVTSRSSSNSLLKSIASSTSKTASTSGPDSPSRSSSSARRLGGDVPRSPASTSSASSKSSTTRRRKSDRRPDGDTAQSSDSPAQSPEASHASKDDSSSPKRRTKSAPDRSKRASIAITGSLHLIDGKIKESSSKKSSSSKDKAAKDKVELKDRSASGSRDKKSSTSRREKDSKGSKDSKERTHRAEKDKPSTKDAAAAAPASPESPRAAEPEARRDLPPAASKVDLRGSALVIKKKATKSPSTAPASATTPKPAEKSAAGAAVAKKKKKGIKKSAKHPILFILPKDFKRRLQRVTLSPNLTLSTVATMICQKLATPAAGYSEANVLFRPLLSDATLHPSAPFSAYGFGRKFKKWEVELLPTAPEAVAALLKETYAPHFGWVNIQEALPPLSLAEAKKIILKLDRQLFAKSDSVASKHLQNLEKEFTAAKNELASLKKQAESFRKDRDRYRKERDEVKTTLNKIIESSKTGTGDTPREVVATIQLEAEIKRLNSIIADMTNDSFQMSSETNGMRKKLEDAEEAHKVAMFKMRMEYADQLEKLEEQIEYLLGRNEWIAEGSLASRCFDGFILMPCFAV